MLRGLDEEKPSTAKKSGCIVDLDQPQYPRFFAQKRIAGILLTNQELSYYSGITQEINRKTQGNKTMTTAALRGMLDQIDKVDEIEALVIEPPVKAARAAAPKMMTSSASFAAISAMEHSDRSERSADRADAALEGCLATVKFTQTVAKSTGLLVPQVDSRLSEHEEIFAGHRREVNNRVARLESALKHTAAAIAVALAIAVPLTATITASVVTNSINSANSTQQLR